MARNPVLQLRQRAGITQAELARLAGTSQSTIAAYESGAKSPTFRTLERLADALSLSVEVVIVPPMTREDRRSLAYHRALAPMIRSEPGRCVEHAKRNLARLKTMHPHAAETWDRWSAWLALPADDLITLMLGHDLTARELRHSSPFAGLLSDAERSQVLKAFQKSEAA